MANLDQTEATNLLKALMNGTAYTVPPAWYLALDSAAAASATAFGTEITNAGGSTYARQTIPNATAASAAAFASSGAVTYTNMPSGTVNGVEVFTTSSGTTRRLLYGTITAKTTNLGDTFTVPTGSLQVTLS